MKLKCVKNKIVKQRLLLGDKTERHDCLTVGKSYSAYAVPIVSTIMQGTDISESNIYFLVFDDSRGWNPYPKSLFEPAE